MFAHKHSGTSGAKDGSRQQDEPMPPSSPPLRAADSEYFDLNVIQGVVSTNTKPFKDRVLVWIGFWKVLLLPLYQQWWLARISPLRFMVGCVLYILHNTLTFLYVSGSLPQAEGVAEGDASVTQIEILLPYVIGALFGVGYGSVVAARGGVAPGMITGAAGGAGHHMNGSTADGTNEEMQMRMQEEEDRHMSDDDYDEEEEEEMGLSGSSIEYGGGGGGGGALNRDPSTADSRSCIDSRTGGGGGGIGAAVVTNGNHASNGVDGEQRLPATVAAEAGAEAAAAGRVEEREPRVSSVATRETSASRVTFEDGANRLGMGSRSGERLSSSLSPTRFALLQAPETGTGEGSSGGGGGGGSGWGGGVVGPKIPLPLLSQVPSFDWSAASDADDEDDDEDDGGWGQVVVKPVKVARYDKETRRWSKTMLSLPELRKIILTRAEKTPQKVTYRRAATLGLFATTLLPVVFTIFKMVATAWANTDSDEDSTLGSMDNYQPPEAPLSFSSDTVAAAVAAAAAVLPGEAAGSDPISSMLGGGAAGAEGAKLEAWTWMALERAVRAGATLIMRGLRPASGDGAAMAIAAVSACSVTFLAWPTFRALADAERTYQRRYMYSKYFCALTSSQRARKHRLPFFSLKNVANIRVWLALRAGKTWLRRHRRERSADAVVSMSFFLSLALIAAILSEVVSRDARFLSSLVHWELLVWCCCISFFLLRYLTLGSNTNNRYRDTSVLLTEQINVQLRILQNNRGQESRESKASKRERLLVSSNVLKLATKLLKEISGPSKLSGLAMNPVLYNVTRVVLVSALSGVMSDTLGFNIKLWKVISFK